VTDVVFDGRAGRPYTEDDPVSPRSDYGRAKAEAERLVAEADPGAVMVRTSLIYGGPGRPPSKHEHTATDPEATFFTDELRCPVQVDDLAAALPELCRSPRGHDLVTTATAVFVLAMALMGPSAARPPRNQPMTSSLP
jgi:dTDP-4-dehydrorhamnose reductase